MGPAARHNAAAMEASILRRWPKEIEATLVGLGSGPEALRCGLIKTSSVVVLSGLKQAVSAWYYPYHLHIQTM